MKQSVLATITRVMLYLLLFVVLSCMVAVTFSSRWVNLFFYGSPHITAGVQLFLRFFVYAAGAIAVWILVELILVLRTLSRDPFIERNCRAFFRMGIVALTAGLLFIASTLVAFTFATVICAIVMLLCGMFALVLAEVFKKAIEYKHENDLTI